MSAHTVAVRSHPRCLGHAPGLGHPESGRRVQVILDALEAGAKGRWTVDRQAPLPPDEDVVGVLKWIHDPEYIDRVRRAADEGSGWLDTHDCRVSTGTWEAALAAAGLALNAALDLVNGRLERAFIALRPPSHHAEKAAAKGYCFFNAVALAAEVVVQSWNRPVLIVDFDAHHGNGTQRHFYDRSDVGYVSVHGFPAFPGTGTADETGEGEGEGFTRNVPLALGADDQTYCAALENAVDEIGARVEPSAVIVSAGFNAHVSDPVGGMRLSEAGFRRLSAAVMSAAERWSEGRVLSFLEGGFDLQAVANIARIHVEELAAGQTEKPDA
ncbi:MAG: histone deacetylase [Thermoanaerobaculales bacterium]|jgi:acetoin utilization deacetylase AcuC-like enzyme|nr:histone deacetylase [Thermoanaerobaculales bacterium]